MRILIKTSLNKNFNFVFENFNVDLFKALKPPLLSLDVKRFDGCEKGDEVHLKVGLGPVKKSWVSHIVENGSNEKEHFFVDVGHIVPPPIKNWRHTHRVLKSSEDSCVIHDDIEFSSGNTFLDYLIYPAMYFQFWLRKPAYKKFFK